ncbi:adenylate/guanylate cyclase domain-containing protein [Marimonas sp. MJW-29]|uniref:Adenylate/guanylate cyclase domain-containing protein n=1 Tax=Sulfitobacter sediminis TaxID=3234186 RepID=A0ABV3RIA9_9RHOB
MLGNLIDWFRRQTQIGLEGLPDNEVSGRYAYNVTCLLGAVFTVPFVIGYALAGAPLLAVTVSPLMLNFLLPRLIPLVGQSLALLIGGSVLISVFVVATFLTGASSGLYLFMFNGIVAVALLQSVTRPKESAVLVLVVIVAMAASRLLFPEPSGLLDVGEGFNRTVYVVTLIVLTSQIAAILFSLTAQVAQAEAALAAEHARSEALLQNLLPDEIATRLKDRPGEVIADGLPAVTLLFAHIVDFTPRSARMSPETLVGWLNRIFSAFDVLTAERGLEKIKTIGDAYMVAAGLPVARKDHAEIIADMALAMQAEVKRLSQELGEPIDLRIGIHSGPAIAGVIGTSKVFYDVWGDTVNTASRMESHGEPGRIQVTAATRALLADRYEFAPRGPVEIKGIGRIETFWLTGKR